MECPKRGVGQVRIPWAEDRSRFTALFEAMAISMLGEATVLGDGKDGTKDVLVWHRSSGVKLHLDSILRETGDHNRWRGRS